MTDTCQERTDRGQEEFINKKHKEISVKVPSSSTSRHLKYHIIEAGTVLLYGIYLVLHSI